jgi:hypothetical protein
MTPLDVDDRQPSVPEPTSGEVHLAGVVRPAMLEPRK